MPIYEYQCQSCGHHLEKLQRMSDDPLKECPNCGESQLKRLVSAAAFRLKGGGWYETDFKQGKKKNLHGSDSSSKSGDSDQSASKTDSGKSGDSKSSGASTKSDSKSSSSASAPKAKSA